VVADVMGEPPAQDAGGVVFAATVGASYVFVKFEQSTFTGNAASSASALVRE